MKRIASILLSITLSLSMITVSAKEYKPTWESLDSRECPVWFEDAKFGIFIHWGLYSVPAYTMKGTYAEWYGSFLMEDPNKAKGKILERHQAVKAFHDKNYGEDFKYESFVDSFTCELFDPAEWANIFKRSGAKYIVLTTKHHDGYCLWDNKEASVSFGRDWNSVVSGPKRDLVGELTTAVRNEGGMKMGFYYSIWDWFNPYWDASMQEIVSSGTMDVDLSTKSNKTTKYTKEEIAESKAGLNKYIHEVMYPQFKELVLKYKPALLFSDGDWWMNDDLWQTRPLLAWLFNNAPNKDEVVINDRWGKVRAKHGGYFTTEYGSGFEGIDRPWEENRGIGMSFGYNRIENIDDYRSEKELIYMLVDLVSRGGNLLLNIGPRADGTIPTIMQERLIEIGNWLDVNGEAIYGTRAYKNSSQWSEGKIPTFTQSDFHNGFPIFEMTHNPKEGNAIKQMWFTSKDDTLYALTPGFPDDLVVKGIGKASSVEMLGVGKLSYKIKNGNLHIDTSSVKVGDIPCNYVYTFKISDIE